MLESKFQGDLITDLEEMFPGCYVLINDANQIQGFPDLTILHPSGQWATLECKKGAEAPYQPNQKYYIADMDDKGFSRSIFPENREEVLHDLQRSFRSRRTTRVSRSK